MLKENNKGQSTVEYIVLVTAVIAVMILFVTGSQKGGLQEKLNSMINTAAERMDEKAQTLQNTYHSPTNPSPPPGVPSQLGVNPNQSAK